MQYWFEKNFTYKFYWILFLCWHSWWIWFHQYCYRNTRNHLVSAPKNSFYCYFTGISIATDAENNFEISAPNHFSQTDETIDVLLTVATEITNSNTISFECRNQRLQTKTNNLTLDIQMQTMVNKSDIEWKKITYYTTALRTSVRNIIHSFKQVQSSLMQGMIFNDNFFS